MKAATALCAPARFRASSSMMVPLMNVTRCSISGASNTSTSCVTWVGKRVIGVCFVYIITNKSVQG